MQINLGILKLLLGTLNLIVVERWGEQIKDSNIQMYTSVFSTGGKGTITLYPIDTDKKTISLTLKKLETKTGDTKEVVEGNWNFEIHIKKYEGKSYDINATVKVDNYTIEFNKITISPNVF